MRGVQMYMLKKRDWIIRNMTQSTFTSYREEVRKMLHGGRNLLPEPPDTRAYSIALAFKISVDPNIYRTKQARYWLRHPTGLNGKRFMMKEIDDAWSMRVWREREEQHA